MNVFVKGVLLLLTMSAAVQSAPVKVGFLIVQDIGDLG